MPSWQPNKREGMLSGSAVVLSSQSRPMHELSLQEIPLIISRLYEDCLLLILCSSSLFCPLTFNVI
jgi:hypothetical protein